MGGVLKELKEVPEPLTAQSPYQPRVNVEVECKCTAHFKVSTPVGQKVVKGSASTFKHHVAATALLVQLTRTCVFVDRTITCEEMCVLWELGPARG